MSRKVFLCRLVVVLGLAFGGGALGAAERLDLYPTVGDRDVMKGLESAVTLNGMAKEMVRRRPKVPSPGDFLKTWTGSSGAVRLAAADADLVFRVYEGSSEVAWNSGLRAVGTLQFQKVLWVLVSGTSEGRLLKDLAAVRKGALVGTSEDQRRMSELLAALQLDRGSWRRLEPERLTEPEDQQVIFLLAEETSSVPHRLIKEHGYKLLSLNEETVQRIVEAQPFWSEVVIDDPDDQNLASHSPLRRTVGIRSVLVTDHLHQQATECVLNRVLDGVYGGAQGTESRLEVPRGWAPIDFRTARSGRAAPMHPEAARWLERKERLVERRGIELRASRFKSSPVVDVLFIGEKAEITRRSWDTVEIRTVRGRKGWVLKKHLLLDERTYLAVNSLALHLRAGPSKEFPRLNLLHQGELLEPIDPVCWERESWCEVRAWDGFLETRGWIATRFVREAGPVGFLSRPRSGLKVGFIYIGDLSDFGWSRAHDEGRLEIGAVNSSKCGPEHDTPLDKVRPGKVATVCREAVFPNQVDRVIRELIALGCDVIFATSLDYQRAVLQAAYRYRDVLFFHTAGTAAVRENYSSYLGRIYEVRYLTGIVAGMLAREQGFKKIGFVGAKPVAEVIRSINAFTLGVHEVAPGLRVQVAWNGYWINRPRSRRLTNCLMKQGVRILAMGQDSSEVPLTVERRQRDEGKEYYVIGYHMDMSEVAKKTHLTAPIWRWGSYYQEVENRLRSGSWKPEQAWLGLDSGPFVPVALAPFNAAVPEAAKVLVRDLEEEIRRGDKSIFQGPISDHEGLPVVPRGHILSDEELLEMNFFVDGVEFSSCQAEPLS